MVKPSASSAYIAPRLTPLMTCCSRRSRVLIASGPPSRCKSGHGRQRRQSDGSRTRRRWRDADVFVLGVEVVERLRLVHLVLEHADYLVEHVAILVERDVTLQGL